MSIRATREQTILYNAKYRAKKFGVPFSLTSDDIVIPDRCPVLGIPLVTNHHGRKGYFPDSPSLDRAQPKLGYVPGNVRIISARANLLKNDAKVWELEAVLADMRGVGCD